MERVLIAFSGGVDSTFLLKAAAESNVKEIVAVTGISESMPAEEVTFSKEISASMNVTHIMVETYELRKQEYVNNPPDRCYYCKKELFSKLKELAAKLNCRYILDGTNADDARDWRPGFRAAQEEGVRSPLLDAGLTKADIRELSKSLGLPTWNKASSPCLSSRFPYGQKISAESLNKVHRAEMFIKQQGIEELRVRYHGDTARIEVHPEDFPEIMKTSTRKQIIDFLTSLGFRHITLDLQGFRSGSGNEVLENKDFLKN